MSSAKRLTTCVNVWGLPTDVKGHSRRDTLTNNAQSNNDQGTEAHYSMQRFKPLPLHPPSPTHLENEVVNEFHNYYIVEHSLLTSKLYSKLF